jgi:hypothetical protein
MKESVDIGKARVYIFGIDRYEKMVRAPVGEEEGEGEDVAQEYW